MAQAKITSYVDAVNAIARNAMREDLAKALEPIIALVSNLHRVNEMQQRQLDDAHARIAELRERVRQLESDEGKRT